MFLAPWSLLKTEGVHLEVLTAAACLVHDLVQVGVLLWRHRGFTAIVQWEGGRRNTLWEENRLSSSFFKQVVTRLEWYRCIVLEALPVSTEVLVGADVGKSPIFDVGKGPAVEVPVR